MKKGLLFLFCINFYYASYAQWYPQSSGTNRTLLSVYFTD